jgi:diazepam-binding inhibitor (GABA receptor modulator, acyl-CoA-binding protein)
MSVNQEFEQAAKNVQNLPSRPDNDTLLTLYALYKQATDGDVQGSRPGMLDLKGRKKYDAWASKKGVSQDQAMKDYVALVNRLTAGK